LLHGIIEELRTLLLQVNQTITLKSGVQALTRPEGFAPSLAPIVQKYPKATPCVMTHFAKNFPGIPVVEVIAPSAKDGVYFSYHRTKPPFVGASSLSPDFALEYLYGLLTRHDVQIFLIPAVQVPIISEGESQKLQALFLTHSDNTGFVPVDAESKVCFEFLFQPAGNALSHKPCHYHKVVGKPYHSRSGESVGAVLFFVKGPVEPVKVDVRKKRGDYPALRSPLFGTADGAVFFHYRTLKPSPDQFEDTPVGYAPLEFFHQRLMGNTVKVARKIRVIHFQPSELEVSFDLVKGSMGAPFGAKSMGAIKKVRLEDRFEDKKYGCLSNSVPHARYAERAQVAVGLGDIDATPGMVCSFWFSGFPEFRQDSRIFRLPAPRCARC